MFNFFACWETLHAFFVVDLFSKLTFFIIYIFFMYTTTVLNSLDSDQARRLVGT